MLPNSSTAFNSDRQRVDEPAMPLPPRCRIVAGELIADSSLFRSFQYLAVLAVIAGMLGYAIPFLLPAGIFTTLFFSLVIVIPCLGLWRESVWRLYRFDLRRRFYQRTFFAAPFFQRKTLDTDGIAGIYPSPDSIWIVRRSSPKQNARLATVGVNVPAATAEQWAVNIGEALGVPAGYKFLAQFPQRNPRYSRYDSERIAFRKHPFQRLVAAVFSKAFAGASLVASGAVSFALVRHAYLPVHLHFTLSTNSDGFILSVVALLLLYVAGPQDLAFDLNSRTYTLSIGLLYFAQTRTGGIDQDLDSIAVLTSDKNGSPRSKYSRAPQRQVHTIIARWKNGTRTALGTFPSRGEALAHAQRLAVDLSVAFSGKLLIGPWNPFSR